jgi:hypothetical protein
MVEEGEKQLVIFEFPIQETDEETRIKIPYKLILLLTKSYKEYF